MDQATSQIVSQVLTVEIGGFKAVRYIDRGASALVFEAIGGVGKVALKVFDPAFLEKHGKAVQTQRINRQLLLKGKHHDNLVDILDGGLCPASGYHYIVMPFLDAPRLDQIADVMGREHIRPIISQIAAAARFLEEEKLFHRDIKPANIAVTDKYDKAVLLDLGVLRPLGLADLTDNTDTKPFTGTTRYSPPEFLFRDEDDTLDGWRAVTFYQLGAVLHDLLMRRPLFQDRTSPYPCLVRAVMIEDPVIDCRDAPLDLIRLAKACLLKDPAQRLRLVTWDSFQAVPPSGPSIASSNRRIQQLRSAKLASSSDSVDYRANDRLASDTARNLASHLRQSCIEDSETFPPLTHLDLVPNAGTATFVLSFAPSHRHALDQHLHCIYQVKAVQADPKVIAISLAVGVSPGTLDLSVVDSPFRILYEGGSDSHAQEIAMAAIYAAFVATLEEAVLPAGSAASRSAVTWLSREVNVDARPLVD